MTELFIGYMVIGYKNVGKYLTQTEHFCRAHIYQVPAVCYAFINTHLIPRINEVDVLTNQSHRRRWYLKNVFMIIRHKVLRRVVSYFFQ